MGNKAQPTHTVCLPHTVCPKHSIAETQPSSHTALAYQPMANKVSHTVCLEQASLTQPSSPSPWQTRSLTQSVSHSLLYTGLVSLSQPVSYKAILHTHSPHTWWTVAMIPLLDTLRRLSLSLERDCFLSGQVIIRKLTASRVPFESKASSRPPRILLTGAGSICQGTSSCSSQINHSNYSKRRRHPGWLVAEIQKEDWL